MILLRLSHGLRTILELLAATAHYLFWCLAPEDSKAARITCLTKELAFYRERKIRPRSLTNGARLTFVWLTSRFAVSDVLHVQPATLRRWQRHTFRLLWRWKSRRRGRPPIPKHLRQLIRQMVKDNPGMGERQIADQMLNKLGIRVSPRTVAKYWPPEVERGDGRPVGSQPWASFVRNHARAIVACDFFVAVTATFRTLYVFVMMELASRKILHTNVTAHPTAEWTAQQFREALSGEHHYQYLIHDRDSIYTEQVDEVARAVGIEIKKTPVRAPQANAFCERLVGTIRRECLDYLIPFGPRHLKLILDEWVDYYNHHRPHRGKHPDGVPRIPEPMESPPPPPAPHRHQIPDGYRIEAQPILGGLRQVYRLKKVA
jgi:transposase InsO family protein